MPEYGGIIGLEYKVAAILQTTFSTTFVINAILKMLVKILM